MTFSDIKAEYEQAHRDQAMWASTLHDGGYCAMAEDFAARAKAADDQLKVHDPFDALGIKRLQLEYQHFSEMATYAEDHFRRATDEINNT